MNGPFAVYQISFTLRALVNQLEWSFIIFVRDTVQKNDDYVKEAPAYCRSSLDGLKNAILRSREVL